MGSQPQSPVTASGFSNTIVSGSGTTGAVTFNSGAQASARPGLRRSGRQVDQR